MCGVFDLSYYDYDLPERCIAQEPTIPQDMAKLLVFKDGDIEDKVFRDLPDIVDPQSVLFFNDTKVMQSRVLVQNKKCILKTGIDTIVNQGEIFVYQIHDDTHMEVLVSDGKHYRPGSIIFRDKNITLYSESFTQDGILFRIQGASVHDFLIQYGQLPLPPYITYTDKKGQWYQTCFAHYIGSAAAPTASLHFTPGLVDSLLESGYEINYATLHVGLGTFKPVYQEDIRKHDIHQEYAMIPYDVFNKIASYRIKDQSIVAVGTTMTRLLESLPSVRKILRDADKIPADMYAESTIAFWDDISYDIDTGRIVDGSIQLQEDVIIFQTKIFIYTGYIFRIVDQLITNFHLPKSSLLMLVAACIGDGRKEIYTYAREHKYRFYSFGDGMIISTKNKKCQ